MLTLKELAALMRAYHAAKIAADKAKALGNQIKAEAAERGVSMLEGGGFIATIKSVESTTFDQTAFKADYPDLYKQYTRKSASVRLYFK